MKAQWKEGVTIAAAILLTAQLIIRLFTSGPIVAGEESYQHLLLSQSPETLYHGILGIGIMLGGNFFAHIFPLILGVVSVYLFSIVLERLGLPWKLNAIAAILFITTPATMYVFSTLNPTSLSLPLALLSFALFRRKPLPAIGSLISLFLLALIGLPEFLFTAGLLVASLLRRNVHRLLALSSLSLVFLVLFLISLTNPIANHPFLNGISDLGELYGVGVFSVIIALLGIAYVWRFRFNSFSMLSFALVSSLIWVVLEGTTRIPYLVLPLVVLGALTIEVLLQTPWTLDVVKTLSLLVILSGLLFSTVSFSKELANLEPTIEQQESLEFLSSQPHGRVLSHESNSYWIEYFASQPAVITRETPPDDLEEIHKVFQIRNLQDANSSFKDLRIDYLWVDDAMFGEVWSDEEDGILFLLRNNQTFDQLHSSEKTQTWKFLFTE